MFPTSSNVRSSQANDADRWPEPSLRGQFLTRVASHWTLFLLCNALAMLLWIRLFEQADLPWSETLRECARRLLPFAIVSLAILPPFVLDTIKLSRRLIGLVDRPGADASNGDATPMEGTA